MSEGVKEGAKAETERHKAETERQKKESIQAQEQADKTKTIGDVLNGVLTGQILVAGQQMSQPQFMSPRPALVQRQVQNPRPAQVQPSPQQAPQPQSDQVELPPVDPATGL